MESKHASTIVSGRVSALKPSATLAVNERSAALKAEGRDIYKLGLGQSPFPVPPPVVSALEANAHQKDYLAVQGLAPLRAAIASWHQRRDGLDVSGDGVMVGPGSKELMFLVQLVHDSILTLPNPSWVSYAPQASILGKTVEWIDTNPQNGWRLSPDELDATCRRTPGQRRLLILNYPNNPTGMTYPADELEALSVVARKHGVIIVSDEIYGELHHEGAHRSIAGFYPEGTIISSGLSKWCGAGGWRLGYFIFPETLRPLLNACNAVASETFTSVSAPIQWAAIRAFDDCSIIETYLRDSRRVVKALGRYCADTLRASGLRIDAPEGGFYLMPDFSPLADQLRRHRLEDSRAMTEQILLDTGVAFLPGVCFGRPEYEYSARLSYVDFDGAAALELVGQLGADEPISNETLRQVCGRTMTAIDRIAAWCDAL